MSLQLGAKRSATVVALTELVTYKVGCGCSFVWGFVVRAERVSVPAMKICMCIDFALCFPCPTERQVPLVEWRRRMPEGVLEVSHDSLPAGGGSLRSVAVYSKQQSRAEKSRPEQSFTSR
jgi:hypothetical protein